MKILQLANVLYRAAKTTDLFSLYNQFRSNSFLKPIYDRVDIEDIPKIVFLARDIGMNKDINKSLKKLDYLYIFSIIEFGDTSNDIDCPVCDGEGRNRCDECGGTGSVKCQTCRGGGEIDCSKCDGYSDYYNDDNCRYCSGSGVESCPDCDGDGSFDCGECGGGGDFICFKCKGDGYIETDEFLPFTTYQYISYDENLKVSLEQSILRNEPYYFNENDDVLIIYHKDIPAGAEYTDEINHKYEKESYVNGFGGLENLTYEKGLIRDYDLTIPNDKFFN